MEKAIVVNMRQRGPGQMAGMGDFNITGVLDSLTGGAVTSTEAQLDRLEVALKISIVASVLSSALAIWAIFSSRRGP
jgi:hypothetical protein